MKPQSISRCRAMSLVKLLLPCACLLLAFSPPAIAGPGQPTAVTPQHFPEPGDVGVFFDAEGMSYVRPGTVPFVPFDLFVVAFAPPGGMEAYEFALTLPAGAIVSQGRLLPPGATDFGAGDDNWIVGTGGICQGLADTVVLVTYRGLLFLAAPSNDATICLQAAQPSSFPNQLPGYLVCNSPGDLRTFAAAYAGCAILNPSLGCIGHLAQLTLELSHQTAAPGAPVTMPVTSAGLFHDPCVPKDLPSPVVVTRIVMDLAWDASVATLTGARFPDDGQGAPTIGVTPGAGVATVDISRATPPLFEVSSTSAQVLLLDFLGGSVAGQTPVTVSRLEVHGDGLDSAPRTTQAGSITTQGVAADARSFGSLKARWGSDQ